jgi:hypothetical protein
MPHYRDCGGAGGDFGDNQPPGAFIWLVEKVVVPANDCKAVVTEFRFDDCGVDGVFGIDRLRTAVGNDETPAWR